jgi:hypothetical protein
MNEIFKPKSKDEIIESFIHKYKTIPIALPGDKVSLKAKFIFNEWRYKRVIKKELIKTDEVMIVKRIYLGRISLQPVYVLKRDKGLDLPMSGDKIKIIKT